MVRIVLGGATRKALVGRLQQAYANHMARVIRLTHALVGPADGKSVWEMAQLLGAGEQTVRDWLHAFVLDGVASLVYRPRRGRPAKLTSAQRQELRQLLVDGPEAAGDSRTCWMARMIVDLIHLRCHVDYAARDVCHLPDQLGFSYQKGKFSADHLNDAAALPWLAETWPEILHVAHAKQAIILLGGEASFARWGSLSDTWAPKGIPPTVPTSDIRKAYRAVRLLDCFGGHLSFSGPRRQVQLRDRPGLPELGARPDPGAPHPHPRPCLLPYERAPVRLLRLPRRPSDRLPVTFLRARSEPDRGALEEGEE
jgi:transposase